MPRQITNSTLGFTLTLQAPTLEEAVALIGREAVEDAVHSIYIYRNWNPKFYDALADALAVEVGSVDDKGDPVLPDHPTKTVEQKGENGTVTKVPVKVSTKEFLANLIATSQITAERANEIAREVSLGDDFRNLDITAKPRESKPSKEALALADNVLARVHREEITAEQWIERYDSVNPQRPFATFGDWTQENVARAIKENSDRAARAAKSELV